MDLNLTERQALVLGASQGIGLAIATTLATEGASVILAGRSAERLEAAAAEVRTTSGRDASIEIVDLSNGASIESFLARLGGRQIDILVNNGGGPPPGAVAEITADVWRQQFEAMLNAPFRITAALLPAMRARKWGRIVNVVSSGVVQPIPNLGISNTLRLSIIGWAKTLAAEVAIDGVTVNSVIPGRIHTSRVDQLDAAAAARSGKTPEAIAEASQATIPIGRYGKPEEFADAVAFLASDRAGYITGASLRIDGGMIRSF
ncbi:SDR family oxidoreductase [Rhizobium mongolense]|uniref:3-oxoacyl-[acyl-carrier protein] reductase n=1 Tax=Rhizobium mongolense TaxID=57676 RepID=A0A7W6WDJ9_9HYPH|nr:SDR family oxidoreductase [Rhizobium mongolense]MBB4273608.1 3-oxoacyl-[acyl-carrier protein] reductase [Rhizobium mongolense]